jgi:hypothetical protein
MLRRAPLRRAPPPPPVCQRAPLSLSARLLASGQGSPRHPSSLRPRRRRDAGASSVAARAAPPIETDAATRVSGSPAAVADYIARVDETWPVWYPRLVSAKRSSTSSSSPASARFEVVVRAAGGGGFLPALDLPVQVELLERSSKRVVFAASSPYHTAQEQYVLMPGGAGGGAAPAYTSVRHVSQVRLAGAWSTPLAAPVVGGLMRAAPQEALERLAAALMAEEQRARQRRSQRQHEAGARRGGRGRRAEGGGGGAFWKGLFGGGSGGRGATAEPAATASDDPYAMYAALGLDPAAVREAARDAADAQDAAAGALVRAAYRRQAKLLHPDALAGGEAAAFLRVQRAYAVLRDANARRRYDRGEWRPDDDEGWEQEGEGDAQ